MTTHRRNRLSNIDPVLACQKIIIMNLLYGCTHSFRLWQSPHSPVMIWNQAEALAQISLESHSRAREIDLYHTIRSIVSIKKVD